MDQAEEIRVDPKTFHMIECATIIRHGELWPDPKIAAARSDLRGKFRREPTLEELAETYDAAIVAAVSNHVIVERVKEVQQAMVRMGHGAPCHLCATPRGDGAPYFEFGLAKILENKTEWGDFGATMALNLLTIPLGFGVGARPGRSTTAQIVRCRLALCEACVKKRTGFFGGLKISEVDCAKHPSWVELHSEGFTKYLDPEELAKYR
jgi:hypothetical protein